MDAKFAMSVGAALIAGSIFAVESSNVVGYSAKAQGSSDSNTPTGILSFQLESVSGSTKLNGFVTPSVAGTMYDHGTSEDFDADWYKTAPKIQIRDSDGGYTVRYYGDDFWDDICDEDSDPDGDGIDGIAGWGDEGGGYDWDTTVNIGGGAWVSCKETACTFTTAGAIASDEVAVGGDSTYTLLCGGGFPIAFGLNDSTKVTWTLTPGTMYSHGTSEDFDDQWYKTAPKIQIRTDDGGYTVRYYGDDFWDDICDEDSDPDKDGIDGIAGWGDEGGGYDWDTTVGVGGGFWLNQPGSTAKDREIFVTVKNPITK